jgi:hypothetical protein
MVLSVYNQTDRVFNTAFLYQGMLSFLTTGAWYAFASKYRILPCNRMLKASIPIVFLLSNFPARGLSQQIVAARVNTVRDEHRRLDNYLDYKIELRNKKIIE